MTTTTPEPPSAAGHHPAVLAAEEARAAKAQLRVADAITRFAGSMLFVYIHAVVFAVWCSTGLFGIDRFPFNFLTMAVSLEAIFLSTFVMIGQNRQAEFAQRKADHDFNEQERELKTNTELTRQIHALLCELDRRTAAGGGGAAAAPAS
ncbi:DUF1003 domain-containing protein [Aquihabitans sp. G128]|uniref:DUF1003 domain-containing protein n=1 Tax=Aquihabitans sp. G128 TaxID=2849779 RepID=UPI001C21B093|nr:DUF1003 domain-containing protein [Aquihabitans sp. G128]QXC63222.1 DUF1003 domain-containing protein [Aquihabitans sp. G128]